jgi:hypothetical protein
LATLAGRFRVLALARHRFALLHVDSVVVHLGVVKAVVEVLRAEVYIQLQRFILCSSVLLCTQGESCGDHGC